MKAAKSKRAQEMGPDAMRRVRDDARLRAWARQVEQLFDRLQDPEDLGHAVSNEVRGLIRQLRRKPDDA